MLWLSEFNFICYHLIHNINGYKHSDLFCTKFHILLFITYIILLGNHEFFLFYSIVFCKAVLSNPINVHLSIFMYF